jgi:ABC-type Fe3+/spermidine/putrescine transport system ATPase subunit
MIAGFEPLDSGRIELDGTDISSLSARKRPTAMVFQNYALFPHMTVGRNVAYGLDVRGRPKAEIKDRVQAALERVDMMDFVDSPVTSLSGGQQQRVALARAVAVEPKVILFDEPLSNLDVALRHQTRRELKALQHRIGLTSIYVTHDQEEAMALSDRIAVMRAGRIVEWGKPEDLYREPKTAFVASFLGGANVVTHPASIQRLVGVERPGPDQALVIRAEDLVPSSDGVSVRVESRQFLGFVTELVVRFGDDVLRALVPGAFSPPSDDLRLSVRHFRFVDNDL